MTERGLKSKPKKSLGLPTKPKQIPGPEINLNKSHAVFPSLKNLQKALNDITCLRYLVRVLYSTHNYEVGIRGHYHESSDYFE